MPENSESAILHRLADSLPDTVLAYLFPHDDSMMIRAALRKAAAVLRENREETVPAKKRERHREKDDAGDIDRVRLYTDGASRGNPGKAGAGVVILDQGGREVLARSAFLGECTNNVAEYQALRLGLQEATAMRARHVDIFLDSELIVRQIEGSYRVKHPALKELYEEVRRLLGRFLSYRIRHIPREMNKRADGLANDGIDNSREFGVGA